MKLACLEISTTSSTSVVPVKLGLVKLPESDDNTSIFNADGILQIGDFRTSKKVTPYLFGGGGASFEKDKDMYFNIPFGLGLNLRLSPYSYINIQGEMRKSLEEKRDNLQVGAGYVYLFHKRPDNKPLKTPKIDNNMDTDKDGIPDVLDHCPMKQVLLLPWVAPIWTSTV